MTDKYLNEPDPLLLGQLTFKLVGSQKELKEALKVRQEVFVEEQGISPDEEYDGHDEEALHMVVSDAGRVVATARVRFPSAKQAKIERMAVLKPFRRRGIGRGIISFLSEELSHRQIDRLVLHAQCSAVAFYRSCGFKESGAPFREAGIRHIKMERQLHPPADED